MSAWEASNDFFLNFESNTRRWKSLKGLQLLLLTYIFWTDRKIFYFTNFDILFATKNSLFILVGINDMTGEKRSTFRRLYR